MPDLDSFDLDAAFRGLEDHVAGLTTPRGAGVAVATARRRRRTTMGAIAAVTVLAVGGAAIGQGLHDRDQSVGPAGQLPDPAPLTAQSLSAATADWISGWSSQDSEGANLKAGAVEKCLSRSDTAHASANQTRGSGNEFFTSGDSGAVAILLGYDGKAEPDAIWHDIVSTFDACSGSTPAAQLSWDGAEARSYAVTAADGDGEHFWVALEGTTIGLVWVTGEPDAITAASDDGVSRALVAALEFPGSMKPITDSSESSSSSSSSSSVSISSVDFGQAVGAWKSGWSATGDEGDASNPPCGAQVQGERSGSGSSLGSNGDQELYGFSNAAQAADAVQSFTTALTACTSATYTLTSVPSSYGVPVTVVTGSGHGADVIWIVQMGKQIGYVAVPAGDSPPPAAVSKAIGDLLAFDLKVNPNPGDASSDSGPVEQKDATSPATAGN